MWSTMDHHSVTFRVELQELHGYWHNQVPFMGLILLAIGIQEPIAADIDRT